MTTNEEERLVVALHDLVADERPSPLMLERVSTAVHRSSAKRRWPRVTFLVAVAVAVLVVAVLVTGHLASSKHSHHPPATTPPVTIPQVTHPPVTVAPVTNPPVSLPPVSHPPVTGPVVTSPSANHGAAPSRPVTRPPATQPPTTVGETTTTGTTTTSTTVAGAAELVTVVNCAFDPDSLSLPTGSTIRFLNQGNDEAVVIGEGPSGASRATFELPPGKDATYTLSVVGDYSFACAGSGSFTHMHVTATSGSSGDSQGTS